MTVAAVPIIHIDFYVGTLQTVVKRGIAMEQATDALIQLIKDHGRWAEPPAEEQDMVISINRYTIKTQLKGDHHTPAVVY